MDIKNIVAIFYPGLCGYLRKLFPKVLRSLAEMVKESGFKSSEALVL